MLLKTLKVTADDGDEILIPISKIQKVRKGKFNNEAGAKDCLTIVIHPQLANVQIFDPKEIERVWKLLCDDVVSEEVV